MNQQALQWIIIGITVSFIALEKAAKLFGKKNNPGYGERIATLEEAVKTIKEDIVTIFKEVRKLGEK